VAGVPISNWFGDIVSSPAVVVDAHGVDGLRAVLADPVKYPSPVRAVGSNHSTTPCGVAQGGTVVRMRGMDRVLRVGDGTVTAEAGALYLDVGRELEKHGLQFHVNIELGNLTIGSAACCGTKDSSMPGELGQVSSYLASVKMVTPAGELREVTEEDGPLLRAVRSSYGLFGIIYEATFRVRPIRPLAVVHRIYDLDGFTRALPELRAGGKSIMLYINPFIDQITVELRSYREDAPGTGLSHWQWWLRDITWRAIAPYFSYLMRTYVRSARVRYFIIDQFYRLVDFFVWLFVRGESTLATDQTIRYPTVSNNSRYVFSFCAFPEETYAETLRAYFTWVNDYYRTHGYRPDMTHVGYRVAADDHGVLSYTYRGTAMTIDPVSTGNPGWDDFLEAYNQWCTERGGAPLLNQTGGLTRAQAVGAFGDRLAEIGALRKQFDPEDRLLNEYFRGLLSGTPGEVE
jgi:FAD binding domain/D-arabinono-1,4-lactone oxidase